MEPRNQAARLVGGPFDGDRGAIVMPDGDMPSPETIWAWPCPYGGRCAMGGVHWYLVDPPPDAARYRHHDREDDTALGMSVEVYVWEGLAEPALTDMRTVVAP